MQKDFITATPDTGGGNGTINVTASKNTGNARSTAISIAGSGCSKTISITQDKASVDVPIINLGYAFDTALVSPEINVLAKAISFTANCDTDLVPSTANRLIHVQNLKAFNEWVTFDDNWYIATIRIIPNKSGTSEVYDYPSSFGESIYSPNANESIVLQTDKALEITNLIQRMLQTKSGKFIIIMMCRDEVPYRSISLTVIIDYQEA